MQGRWVISKAKTNAINYICKIIILIPFIAMCTMSVPHAQEDDKDDIYDRRQIKKDYKALAERLKPIHATRGMLQESQYGAGDYERFIQIDNRRRRYEIHVPPGYEKGKPMPVVLNLHGGGGRAGSARLQSRMDRKADRAGFIAVYPNGTGLLKDSWLTWNAGRCCSYAVKHNVDDVGFIRALLDDLENLFSVDTNRIFATGLSNGAFMAYRLACELSDRIAAIAPIAGVMVFDDCKPKYPISILHFHGTLDKSDPYHGGKGSKSVSKLNFPSARQNITGWLKRLNIPSKPVKTIKREHATIEVFRGALGNEVILVTLEGMGHTWPGGRRMLPQHMVGQISRVVGANEMMWEFFKEHPLNTRTQKK